MAKTYIPYTGPIVTRAEALAIGLNRYFTGLPCKFGHLSERHTKKSYCSYCWRLVRLRHRPLKPPKAASLDRMFANAIPEPNSGCWFWLGALNEKGYGIVKYQGRKQRAHRVTFDMTGGILPAGMEIDHICWCRCCINPDHFEVVTHLENIRRRRKRFTSPTPSRSGDRG